nr:MAG TPA: DnaD like replication protein [Caudoviricetes sp.]
MSDNKKYYYLRLKDNFFDSDELKILESMKDGYLYSNILLKLYLRSLKNDGKLVVNDRIPYNAEMLASVTGHQIGTVKQALSIFKELGLIDVLENGAIYMLDIQNFIGRGSSEADRKREYRQRIESDRTNVLTNVRQISDKTPPEIEIEIEKEIKKEINKIHCHVEHDNTSNSINEIIEYLNSKTNKNYRSTTQKTRTLIKARMKEHFTIDDFKIVIDKKCSEWMGTKFEPYLRPETLFGTKFEGYLNQSLAKSETERRIDSVNELIDMYEQEERMSNEEVGYTNCDSTDYSHVSERY